MHELVMRVLRTQANTMATLCLDSRVEVPRTKCAILGSEYTSK